MSNSRQRQQPGLWQPAHLQQDRLSRHHQRQLHHQQHRPRLWRASRVCGRLDHLFQSICVPVRTDRCGERHHLQEREQQPHQRRLSLSGLLFHAHFEPRLEQRHRRHRPSQQLRRRLGVQRRRHQHGGRDDDRRLRARGNELRDARGDIKREQRCGKPSHRRQRPHRAAGSGHK